jgi:SAM-dependent MidA family methyltransferase
VTSDGSRGAEVGVRRVDELDLAAPLPASDPELVRTLVDEIEANGPITFARFMEVALYDPERGYYTNAVSRAGPGRGGDFLTAPESHPIFGWAIARLVEEVWQRLDRPPRFVVREHGAGTGALAAGILDGLRRSGSSLLGAIRYQAADHPGRLDLLQERLATAQLGGHLDPFDDRPAPGVAIANELLDALPVHRVQGAAGGLDELYVTVDAGGRFELALGPPSTPALQDRLDTEGVRLEPGQVAEVCLALDAWVTTAAASLGRGLVLVIDYGYPAADLYAASRGSTLRAYHGHRVHDDPFVAIGRQDLTAHVDFTAVERAANRAGLELLAWTTQARLLDGLGIGELLVGLQSDPTTTLETYLDARSSLVRMLDPRVTGGFGVLAFGHDLRDTPPLRGLANVGSRDAS